MQFVCVYLYSYFSTVFQFWAAYSCIHVEFFISFGQFAILDYNVLVFITFELLTDFQPFVTFRLVVSFFQLNLVNPGSIFFILAVWIVFGTLQSSLIYISSGPLRPMLFLVFGGRFLLIFGLIWSFWLFLI